MYAWELEDHAIDGLMTDWTLERHTVIALQSMSLTTLTSSIVWAVWSSPRLLSKLRLECQ